MELLLLESSNSEFDSVMLRPLSPFFYQGSYANASLDSDRLSYIQDTFAMSY